MRIEPAHIEQIRRARDGRMVLVSADAGGVADDLAKIDPGLKVRFAEAGQPPYWVVFWESPDGRNTELVLTAQAYQNNSGVWEGLDQRIVKRVQEIDPHGRGGYDFAKEVEAQNRNATQARRRAFTERIAPTAELAAHALRKDLGQRYRGRAFVPRDVS
jgi:hypothetical protein